VTEYGVTRIDEVAAVNGWIPLRRHLNVAWPSMTT
jgi:hypothetical protein